MSNESNNCQGVTEKGFLLFTVNNESPPGTFLLEYMVVGCVANQRVSAVNRMDVIVINKYKRTALSSRVES